MATTRGKSARQSRKKRTPGKPAPRKAAARPAGAARSAPQKTTAAAPPDVLLAHIEGAQHQKIGGATVDVIKAGNGRIKRLIYPAGFRWSTHLRPVVGTDQCMHAHVGFLARGHIKGEYADGCAFEAEAPQAVVVEPGHDAWVVGREPAVLIQFDCEDETARHFGLRDEHSH